MKKRKYVTPSKATEMARPGIQSAPAIDTRTEPIYKRNGDGSIAKDSEGNSIVLGYKIPITTERGKRRHNGSVHPDTECRSKPGYRLRKRNRRTAPGPFKGPSKRPKGMSSKDWVDLMTGR